MSRSVRPLLVTLVILAGSMAAADPPAKLDLLWSEGTAGDRSAVVAFAPGGDTVAVAAQGVTLRRTSDGGVVRTLEPPASGGTGIVSLSFSSDGSLLAAGDIEGRVAVWRVSDGSLLHTVDGGAVAFAPGGDLIATARKGSPEVRIWNARSGEPVRTLAMGEASGGIPNTVAFSPNGQMLAVVGREIHLWSWPDGKLIRSVATANQPIRGIAFAPNGKLLASLYSNQVRLWQVSDGAPIRTLSGGKYPLNALAFGPGGDIIAAVSTDPNGTAGARAGELIFWRIDSGRPLRIYPMPQGAGSVAFSNDGRLVACGRTDSSGRGLAVVADNPYASGQ